MREQLEGEKKEGEGNEQAAAMCQNEEAVPTQGGLLRAATQRLAAAGVDVPRRHATWLLAEALEVRPALLPAYPQRAVEAEQTRTFEAMVARRLRGEPLQQILGHAAFFGLRLRVTPDVLIPRPETEQVVEEALRRLRAVEAPRLLDAGTGSGCMALALKHERPHAEVHACDVSTAALAVAHANAEALRLRVRFFEADLLDPDIAEALPVGLDLLISNPPYIPDAEAADLPPEVRGYEPTVALFSGADPLRFYRVLAGLAPRLLAPGGHLVLEAHADYATEVGAVLEAAGLAAVDVERDLAGRPRIVAGRRPH